MPSQSARSDPAGCVRPHSGVCIVGKDRVAVQNAILHISDLARVFGDFAMKALDRGLESASRGLNR